MSAFRSHEDLLFGLIALQNALISQGQLVSAFQTWTLDKSRPLVDHLVSGGHLDSAGRAAVEAMVALHLKKHEDMGKCLAAVPPGKSTLESLARLGDPDLDATLSHVRWGSDATDAGTDEAGRYAVGTTTSDGQRFRVLRPHARGGLGAVFVALDDELNREVALKQILDDHADDPTSRQRFVLEAEVTGGLEHPGIVPVYGLGTYADGRPYYAMRFIRGDSLKQAITRFHSDDALQKDPGRRSLELRKLLRRFLDVCNAIEYAHSRGVLHRDIKPGNIIVGKHGETLVVDWGLAKTTGKPDSNAEEGALSPPSASSIDETMPGSALGTPAFMSPEQARGEIENLGPGSDIYSLGATLYALIAGTVPYQESDLGVLLHAVARGEFPPPRQISPSIDRPLEAICLKAMALKPGDRYARAHDLAEDVERWLADERVEAYSEPWTRTLTRWLARHRTAVTGAAAAGLVAMAGLLAVAAVQSKARSDVEARNQALQQANARITQANKEIDQERLRAEDREQQAIGAVKRFRDAVANNPELKNNRSLESLRKTLLKEPLSFFRTLHDRLRADQGTRPESLAHLASASFELGDLSDEIGDKEVALTALREAFEVSRGLADLNPGSIEERRRLAHAHRRVGDLCSATGRLAEASTELVQSNQIYQDLVAASPTDITVQNDLAMTYYLIAMLSYQTGKPAEARKNYDAAVAIWQKLAAANPRDTNFQSGLASSYLQLGDLAYTTKSPADALKSYDAAVAIYRKLVAQEATNLRFQQGLAATLHNFGLMKSDTGHPAEARKAEEEALAIRRRLADANPSVTEFQIEVAQTYSNFASLLLESGQHGDATKAWSSALEIQQKLADANPTVPRYAVDVAITLNNLFVLERATGKLDESSRSITKALARAEQVSSAHPSVILYKALVANCQYNLGLLLSEAGQPAMARKHYDAALVILQPLIDSGNASQFLRSLMARTRNDLGVLLRTSGQPALARAAFEAARDSCTKEKESDRALPMFQRELAKSQYNLGLLLRDAGQIADARRALDQAMAAREKLAREQLLLADEYASELGETLNDLAAIDLEAGRFDAARDRLQQAITWQKKALAVYPTNPRYLKHLERHLTLILRTLKALNEAAAAAAAQRELDALQPRLTAPQAPR